MLTILCWVLGLDLDLALGVDLDLALGLDLDLVRTTCEVAPDALFDAQGHGSEADPQGQLRQDQCRRRGFSLLQTRC